MALKGTVQRRLSGISFCAPPPPWTAPPQSCYSSALAALLFVPEREREREREEGERGRERGGGGRGRERSNRSCRASTTADRLLLTATACLYFSPFFALMSS